MLIPSRKVFASLALCLLLLPWGLSAADGRHSDALTEMFVWWNAAYKHPDGFTTAAFGKYFTADAVLRVNGIDRCKGLAEWAAHFRDIQAHTEMVEIELPFIDEFESPGGDRIFTHHFVLAREHGKSGRARVMGYAAIANGKISLLNFVSLQDSDPSDSGQK
jgi:hypothetical protein